MNSKSDLDVSDTYKKTCVGLRKINADAMETMRGQQRAIDKMKRENDALVQKLHFLQSNVQQQKHDIEVQKRSMRGNKIKLSRSYEPIRKSKIPPPSTLDKLKVQVHRRVVEKQEMLSLSEWKGAELSKIVFQLKNKLHAIEKAQQDTGHQIKLQRIRSYQVIPKLFLDHTTPRLLTELTWMKILPLRYSALMRRPTSPISAAVEKNKIRFDSSKADVSRSLNMLASSELLDYLVDMPIPLQLQWKGDAQGALENLRRLGSGFKATMGIFSRISAGSHFNELIKVIAEESRRLVGAEHVDLLLIEETYREFWSIGEPTTDESPNISRFIFPVMHPSYMDIPVAELEQLRRDKSRPTPPGIAAYVATSRNPLIVAACAVKNHALYSGHKNSADQLVKLHRTSILCVPVFDHKSPNPVAVFQAYGKLNDYDTSEVTVRSENCDTFTVEDQMLLVGLANFCGPLLTIAKHFNSVEMNKEQDEVLLNLARKMFNCLKLNLLSEVVMKQAKHLLDADRCTLFVAGNPMEGFHDEKTLYSWQTDVSVDEDQGPKLVTIKVPFGVGIAGAVAENGTILNIADAYEDPRFNRSVDIETNYRTKSVLALPVLSSRNAVLGVFQVINKSDGAPFNDKDEELLKAIVSLVALAVENARLFYKPKEICARLGSNTTASDMPHAIEEICSSCCDVIGVESASVYLIDEDKNEVYTYMPERISSRTRVILKPHSLLDSIVGLAMHRRKVIAVNDIHRCSYYNSDVDSINGRKPRNVLVAPLFECERSSDESRLIGLLHLSNKTGLNETFENDDPLVSIITSQCSSVVLTLLEKQRLLRRQEQMSNLLTICSAFYMEKNHESLMNAVNNACVTQFDVQRGQLFTWDVERRHLWTMRVVARRKDQVKASEVGHWNKNLRRRVSIVPNSQVIIPVSETDPKGVLWEVVDTKKIVSVPDWHDGGRIPSSSDVCAQFVEHSVVACPVQDAENSEVDGVLVLVNPRGKLFKDHDMTLLPLLTHQISNALNMCQDIAARRHLLSSMQHILENRKRTSDLVFTLAQSGSLLMSTYPLSILSYDDKTISSDSFESIRTRIEQLPSDAVGDRHVVVLTSAPVNIQRSESFKSWFGPGFESLMDDISIVFTTSRAISVAGFSPTSDDDTSSRVKMGSRRKAKQFQIARPRKVSDPIALAVASVLWTYLGVDLKVDLERVLFPFQLIDTKKSGELSQEKFVEIGKALGITMPGEHWDELCEAFKASNATMVAYQELFQSLCPAFQELQCFDYEVHPTLDLLTREVISVQVFVRSHQEEYMSSPWAK